MDGNLGLRPRCCDLGSTLVFSLERFDDLGFLCDRMRNSVKLPVINGPGLQSGPKVVRLKELNAACQAAASKL